MQGARAVQVDSVQPLLLENLALRSCCQEAWVLSGKQQVAKENQQVRARECGIPGGVKRVALGGEGVRVSISTLIPLGSKGCDSAPGFATAAPVPD